jgi:alpha-galactosidase
MNSRPLCLSILLALCAPHAFRADDRPTLTTGAPVDADALAKVQEMPATLTPPSPATPEIHGAKVFGVHPGHPFLFLIAATGDRPMTFSAEGLPAGLSLDGTTGQITGTAPAAGDYKVTLHAKNSLGEATRPLLIKVGAMLGLTPQMGWNSWNCFAGSVTENDIRAAADSMVSTGLINHGWTYVNVDDYWEVNPRKSKKDPTLAGPERNPDGTIHPNPRFPDMAGMAAYIHSKGLKAGLYSSPGTYTCGGCVGSYQHQDQDAASYAAWGFDYLKYDWCTYKKIYQLSESVEGFKKPYRQMAEAIAKTPRDIFFSFCQYGMGDVWKWGAAIPGNSWRTTGDIRDTWKSMMLTNGERQADIGSYAGPGHWNDPDMLVVGWVGGWKNGTMHPTQLTPDEQYTHISLWCLQAAPLLIGCDLTKLDPFTLGLLTNDEVIDVDQDPLGKAAKVIVGEGKNDSGIQIWARPLEDGSMAVGMINMGTTPEKGTLKWSTLGVSGPHTVHDLWRQRDLGTFPRSFESGEIPSHGVVFVRVSKA